MPLSHVVAQQGNPDTPEQPQTVPADPEEAESDEGAEKVEDSITFFRNIDEGVLRSFAPPRGSITLHHADGVWQIEFMALQ